MRPARPLGGHVLHVMGESPDYVSNALRFAREGGCEAGCDECLYAKLCEGGVFGGEGADGSDNEEGRQPE